MAKVEFMGITFDSEWEKDYFCYLKDVLKVDKFIYHPEPIFDLVARKQYTPDFIYIKDNVISVVEVKGNYNPFANHFQDDMIHKEMKAKDRQWLARYFYKNGIVVKDTDILKYEKVKKLKAHGWVDYEWKNPNTLSNQRKEKINEQAQELKELRDFKKNALRYFTYHLKIVNNEKLTKTQREWYLKYVDEISKEDTKAISGTVVVNHQVELTEEEKVKARVEAMKRFEEECLQEERKKREEEQKAQAKAEEKARKQEEDRIRKEEEKKAIEEKKKAEELAKAKQSGGGEQMSIFDF